MTLKQIREALGMSQLELDRRAGLPRGTTFDVESGRIHDPSTRVSLALTKALHRAGAKGVDVESLFSLQEHR